jgi:DNA-binding transcriptional MerR regulator
MYTTKEAAKALRVQPNTIRRYARLEDKPLRAQHRGRRKDLIIREDDLIKFAEAHGMALELPQA